MTDYQFDSLGSREFEHMAQALAMKEIGASLSVFGDGPDGGREATWEGEIKLEPRETWDGYGVLQAKYQTRVGKPAENLLWFRDQINAELEAWASTDSNRKRKPDFFLIVTNTRLSAVPDHGKDAATKLVEDKISSLKLPIRDFIIWDYDSLRGLLDNASDIRRRYAAFLTSGELISHLLDGNGKTQAWISDAIAIATASSLSEDSPLNLTQAGVMSESGTSVSDVFVDLPFKRTNPTKQKSFLQGHSRLGSGESMYDFHNYDDGSEIAEWIGNDTLKLPGIAASLIKRLNTTRSPAAGEGIEDRSVVLVGGPGQGKSTVTQWLVQLYRTAYLKDIPAVKNIAATRRNILAIHSRATDISMPEVSAKRWPYRVILTELADYLSSNPGCSLLEYLAHDISFRGTKKISAADLLTWAQMYPWVIFVDGLDEVPPSSNRDAVLAALNRMTIELDTVGADVVLVVTTRPQGYGEELETYTHLWLSPLSIEMALKCAEGIIAARHVSGSKKSDQIFERLKRASSVQATSRLFRSPLQVTILTVLLEKLGKAPGDRSRLYSSYYQVISSREQEKSGDLSDLLQRYEDDISALHRQIGFMLQERASSAGETTATLSREEFHELIRAQFRSKGHGEHETEALVAEFARLVTERLVFLAYVVADRVGFEIRSLQEYMAGEYVVSLSQEEVIPAIREIAGSAYWRNVTLFALGSIFARMQHLRAGAVLLCSELNQREPEKVIFLGSELALEILKDGSCTSMPVFADTLARTACEVFSGPVTPEVRKLINIGDDKAQEIIDRAGFATTDAIASTWVNRMIYISAFAQNMEERQQKLAEIMAVAPAEALRLAVQYAWREGDRELHPIVSKGWKELSPIEIFSRIDNKAARLEFEETSIPVEMLVTLSTRTNQGPPQNEDSIVLWASWVSFRENLRAWTWMSAACSGSPKGSGWAFVGLLAELVIEPSPEALALVVEAMPGSGFREVDLPQQTPWIVTACVREAEHRAIVCSGNECPREDAYHAVAEEIRSGKFGDVKSWDEAERNTEPQVIISLQEIRAMVPDDFAGPLQTAGVPVSAMSFTAKSGGMHVDDLTELADELVRATGHISSGPESVAISELAIFLISMVVENVDDLSDKTAVNRHVDWVVSRVLSGTIEADWWPWLGDEAEQTIGSIADSVYIALGKTEIVHGMPSDNLSASLLAKFREDPSKWQLLRLALVRRPELVKDMVESDLQALETIVHDPLAAVMKSAIELGMEVLAERQSSGSTLLMDHVFNFGWLLKLGTLPESRVETLAKRVAGICSEEPSVSARLIESVRSRLLAEKPQLTFSSIAA